MKEIAKILRISILLTVSVVFLFSSAFAIEPIKPVTPVEKLKKPIAIPTCPDLKATLTLTKSLSRGTGVITLNGQVCNVGTANFVSPPAAPAHVSLAGYDPTRPLTADNYKTIAGKDITNLAKGACVTVTGSYSISNVIQWEHRTATAGECQAQREFSLSIGRNVPDDIVWRPSEDCNPTNNLAKQNVKYMVQCPW